MVAVAGTAAVAAGLGKIKARMDGKAVWSAIDRDRGGLPQQKRTDDDAPAAKIKDRVVGRRGIRGNIQTRAGCVQKRQEHPQLRVRAWAEQMLKSSSGGRSQRQGVVLESIHQLII